MKLILSLILLISFASCTNPNDNPTVVFSNAADSTAPAPVQKKEKELSTEDYIKEINTVVGNKIYTCLASAPRMTHSTGDWHYCFLETENMEIVVMTTKADPDRYKTVFSDAKDFVYQDAFVLKNGKFVFAFERIADLTIREKSDQWFWTCNYIYRGNLEIDMVSSGHGPTENEEWTSSLERRVKQYRSGETFNKLREAYGPKK